MARKKVKAPATTVAVPQSAFEAATFIARIGDRQRERARIAIELNDAIEVRKARAEAEARQHAEVISDLMKGLEIWAAANREALTDGGKRKTAVLSTGELRWRMTPPSVGLKSVKLVVKELLKRRLVRFLRRKIEVDKEAILKEPDAVKNVPGISIGQREEFVIVPSETKLEEVRS